jgi:hypothetical protein
MIPAHKPASAALQAGEQSMRLSAIKASYAGHKESAEVVHCDLDRAFALGHESGLERAARWQPIATAPQTGENFVAAARICRAGTKEVLFWQTDVWYFSEGEFKTEADPGLDFDECEIWCALPEYPASIPSGTQVEGALK